MEAMHRLKWFFAVIGAIFNVSIEASAHEWCAVIVATSDGYLALRSGPNFTSLELRRLSSGQFVKVSKIEVEGQKRCRIVTELLERLPNGDLRKKSELWGYAVARYLHKIDCEPNKPPPPPPTVLYPTPKIVSPSPTSPRPPVRPQNTEQDNYLAPPSTTFTHPLPRHFAFQHGVVRRSPGVALAPFRITTSGGANYFFKLVRHSSGNEEMVGFVEGGRPLETRVPVGVYELRYAAGDVWISEDEFFGESTVFAKTDTALIFSVEGEQARGVDVQLILQRGGNLRTSTIRRSEF